MIPGYNRRASFAANDPFITQRFLGITGTVWQSIVNKSEASINNISRNHPITVEYVLANFNLQDWDKGIVKYYLT
jgi:hypothetical protein